MPRLGCRAPPGPGSHLAGVERRWCLWEQGGTGPAEGERLAGASGVGRWGGGELLESLSRPGLWPAQTPPG